MIDIDRQRNLVRAVKLDPAGQTVPKYDDGFKLAQTNILAIAEQLKRIADVLEKGNLNVQVRGDITNAY